MSFAKEVWENLSAINVNDHTEKKGQLTYLSWAWAWKIVMDEYPESEFAFKDPFVYPDDTVEVRCAVMVKRGEESVVRECWLPVMDHKNNAIKAPDARKISDAKMRCLVKCLALHGLGLYIYAGEDVPSGEVEPEPEKIGPLELRALQELCKETSTDFVQFSQWLGVKKLEDLPLSGYERAFGALSKKREKMGAK